MIKRIIISIAAIAAAVLSLTGCESDGSDGGTYKPPVIPEIPPESGTWASFESIYNRYAEGQKHPGQTNAALIKTQWADTVWINDRTHAQIMVWANEESVSDLSYEMSDFTNGSNVIPKKSVTIRFGSYIKGNENVWPCAVVAGSGVTTEVALIADALSKTAVTSAAPGEDPIKIWVTIDTPSNSVPGKYTGTFTIKSDGLAIRTLSMTLLVVNKTLPDPKNWTFHLDMWQHPFELVKFTTPAVTFASAEYFNLSEPFYRLLASVGQKAITTYAKEGPFERGDYMIRWIKKADDSWKFDYTRFDAFVAKMMEWGIDKQINCFMSAWNPDISYFDEKTGQNVTVPFVSKRYESSGQNVIGDALYNKMWTAFLDSFKSHLKTNHPGWFEKVVLATDEMDYEDIKNVISLIKNLDPNWKVGAATNVWVGEDYAAQIYDYSITLGRYSANSTPVATYYTCCTHEYLNTHLSKKNNPAELTWHGWHAAGNGYNGYLRWGYDFWGTSDFTDAAHTGRWAFTAGDGNLVYRLNNSSVSNDVVSTVRLEMLRLGIQDYEKIKILDNFWVNNFAADNFDIPYNDFPAIIEIGKKAATPVIGGQALLKEISAGH